MRCLILGILLFNFLSAADPANLKLALNMPVFYQLHIEGGAKSEGTDPKINFKEFSMDIDFSVIIKNEHQYFPELILTPTKFAGVLKFNQGAAVFDFAKENLTFNSILLESFPFLNAIKLNQQIRIPISDNVEFLKGEHQNYPVLPFGNPEGYANLSKKFLDFINNGLQVKQGKAHVSIPELGMEIYSGEKLVGDQFKGDYTLRFLIPLNAKSGCAETLIGGGKIKNSALTNHVLNSKANGIFLINFQKRNCPKKEMEESYEFRGKLTLTPKVQAASTLTRLF